MFSLYGMFTASLFLGYSGAIMPGPLLSVAVGESARRGFIAGPLLVLGHAILELAVVILLLVGLSQFLGSKLVTGVIGLIGGVVLLWMGYGMIKGSGVAAREAATLGIAAREAKGPSRRGKRNSEAHAEGPGGAGIFGGRDLRGPIISGAVVSVANPYWSIWWATAGAALLTTAAKMGPGGLVAFFLGHITADLTWYAFVALGVSAGRHFWEADTYRRLILFSGVFLLALGALFIYYGATSVA